MTMSDVILEVRDLCAQYTDGDKTVRAVDGVNLSLRRGTILALVGESGCGKTTTALAILGLLPHPGQVIRGEVLFDGEELLSLSREKLRRLRGQEISMIFQDPVSGLNPVLSVGEQVEEIISSHTKTSGAEARRMVYDSLQRVGLTDPEQLTKRYPYQLSGGMCQRVIIAIATMLNPKVIIADEPTSSLDVTVQAGILNELEHLRADRGVSILLNTHDLIFRQYSEPAELVRRITAFSEETQADTVLRRMGAARRHIALVGTPESPKGIVALEDLVGALVDVQTPVGAKAA